MVIQQSFPTKINVMIINVFYKKDFAFQQLFVIAANILHDQLHLNFVNTILKSMFESMIIRLRILFTKYMYIRIFQITAIGN